MKQTKDANAGSLQQPGYAAAWSVEVWVCGTYAGDYDHETEAQARADADQRSKDFGILGCRYKVRHNDKLTDRC